MALLAIVLSADDRCLPCHAQHVKSYAQTGMGRSVSRPSQEAEQQVRQFRVRWQDGKLIHSVASGGHQAAYPVTWAVGSGNQGKSYLVAIKDALFQSPISWYTARRTWDLSPGYEQDAQPDFFRPVTPECLSCHTGHVRPREGTLNRYLDPPFAPASIDCDRCHGDPAAHLATASRNNIVNPSRLEPSRRDAVCEQCHLSGAARIPNPGNTFTDFRPGMRMEDVFSVYVKEAAGFKVVSHSEQMVRSRCFLEGGRTMWCGTCHDPHQEPVDQVSWYREKCLGCHQVESHRNKMGEDCAGCHMPKIRPYDGGHTAFHDHWIRAKRDNAPESAGGELRAWREPDAPLRRRNLGLAYISAGELSKGFPLLASYGGDGAVETARGFVLLKSGRAQEAVRAFRRAVEEHTNDSTLRLNLAAALFAAKDLVQAKLNAENAIALEPLLEDAYVLLAEIEPKRASYWKQRYLELVPQRRLH
jgi:nitrate reductase cytochrome c-type subunit